MSKRMQVLVDERESRRLQAAAREQGLTQAEWVRQWLRGAAQAVPTGDVDRKLAAVRLATQQNVEATPDVDQMLVGTEAGYHPKRP